VKDEPMREKRNNRGKNPTHLKKSKAKAIDEFFPELVHEERQIT
jgi:hypothetical protein